MFREGPMPPSVRVMLANMCDPDTRDTFKLRLTFKRERGASKIKNDRRAAAVVWERMKAGDKCEAAIQHAVDTLGVSRSFAEKAFAKWNDKFAKSKVKGLIRTSE
jgi:hypothetical protein